MSTRNIFGGGVSKENKTIATKKLTIIIRYTANGSVFAVVSTWISNLNPFFIRSNFAKAVDH